jgi:hypothetical protein
MDEYELKKRGDFSTKSIQVLGFDWSVRASKRNLDDINFIPSVLNVKKKTPPPKADFLKLVLEAKMPSGYTGQSYNIQAYVFVSFMIRIKE